MLVKVGAVFGLATVMLVMLLGQTRVFYSMSKDGLLPKWASAIHPKFRTPWITTIVLALCGHHAGVSAHRRLANW
jgi:basic amino acid/polyamine antiporter, APA family